DAHCRKIFRQMLYSWLMTNCGVWKVRTSRWFGWILAAATVNVIKLFRLRIKRLKILIRNGPRRRNAFEVRYFAEILLAHSKKRCTVKFCIAADVIIGM